MKTNNLIHFVILLGLLLVSCKERVREELRPLQANYTYSVVYNKDSIVIEEQNDGKKHAEPLVLVLSNGEYYINDNDNDKVLFLSTKRDTIVEMRDKSDDYLININKRISSEGLFSTEVLLKKKCNVAENNRGGCSPSQSAEYIMTLYYDATCHVVKIHKADTIVFQ